MIPLNSVFWGLVFLFGLVGALRGWAKEIMVASSVLLAMFVQQVFGQYVLGPQNPYLPVLLPVSPEITGPDVYSKTQFYVCTVLLFLMAFFGYAGPTLVRQIAGKVPRERLQDALLGFFLGLVNGYLIIGMLWFYLHKSGYAVGGVTAPGEGTPAWTIAQQYLLPVWFTTPMLYVAIALAFLFIIIVFI
ncbi:MAG: CvpA family protein [Anaerolineae bacterium]